MVSFEQKNDPATNKMRICRASRMLQHLCTGVAITVPFAAALYWAGVTEGSKLLPSQVDGLPFVLTPASRTIAYFSTMVPGAVLIWSFLTLRRLFGLYASNQIFSAQNVRCFRQLGFAALAWTAADLMFGALLSVGLTFNNPPGERFLTVSATGVNLTALFAGIFLLVISWVMDEARRLDEEQSQII